MIFITTGSRSFQFNRLLKAVDDAVSKGLISEPIFAQIGSSDYEIKNYEFVDFLNREEFNANLAKCDVVLTHGGTGVIVNSAKAGKRVVAVPRLAKYGEVVDDHQIQLIEAFEKLGIVTACYECSAAEISKAINSAKCKEIVPYNSNSQTIINSVEKGIVEMCPFGMTDKNKTRVLMCSSARTEKGGMNSVIDQLMDHEWGDNYQFSYLATHISGNPVKKVLFFQKSYNQLKKLLKKDSFDIIHIHMSYKGSFYRKYYVTKLCKKYNKKIIIHLHGSEFKDFYNNGNNKRKRQIEELFSISDCTIVLGDDWKIFINQIAPKANVVVINNAIKIPDYNRNDVNEVRSFLFLGALIKRKGVMDLLNAVLNISNNGIKSFKVLIAGSGIEEENLKEYVNRNGLGDIVEFLGWIGNDKKTELLKNTDVLVLPSYNEGLPIAILEAMSYSIPIISTNVGSISEAVKDGENGFLITPGDVNALSEAMVKLIVNTELWKTASLASKNICVHRFSEDVFFKKIKDVYQKI